MSTFLQNSLKKTHRVCEPELFLVSENCSRAAKQVASLSALTNACPDPEMGTGGPDPLETTSYMGFYRE